MKFSLGERFPEISDTAYIAHNATVIGSVIIEDKASIWFNAVLRGDCETIRVGPQSNVQDGSVLHTDPGYPLSIGRGVTIGHKAMLHGCSIGDFSLIGINAVVLNGAIIGKHCLIGANALVTEGMEIPDGSVVMGSPGKIKKELRAEQRLGLESSAEHYVKNGRLFSQLLKPIE